MAQSGSDYETVVITASRYSDDARLQQKNAINIVNVQSAEEILKFPDFNAAESIARMPGIYLMADTGEGRFVMIRGIDANLNGTTYGGVVMMNTNPGGTYQGGGGRAVELDTVPGGAIDGIIVTKSLTPDHDAEGLGGTIELTPRTAANITKPFVDLSLGGGYEPIHGHGGPYNGDIAIGARFGFDDSGLVIEQGQSSTKVNPGFVSNPTPFSFVVSASWREDRRGFDDMEEDYMDQQPHNPVAASGKVYDDLQFRMYNAHRKRFGVGGEFDFKPNDEHRYYFRANMFGYDEQINKNHLVFNTLGGDIITSDPSYYPISVSGNKVSTQTDITISGTNSQEIARNNIYVLGGEDDFHVVKIDYHVAYSRATDAFHSFGPRANGPSGVYVTYDNIDNPNFPMMQVTDGTNLNDPTLYTLTKISASKSWDADQEYSYAGNADVPVDFLSSDDHIKFGFSVRLRTKSGTPYNNQSLKVNKPLTDFSPLAADTNYYHNRYTNGPHINENLIVADIQNGTLPALNPWTVDSTGAWSGDENVYAAYGMYTGEYGNWSFLAGLRVEDTVAKYAFYDDGSGGFNNGLGGPVTLRKGYTNFFPSAQVRYEFSPELQARFAYSSGIARPGFTQVAGSSSEDPILGTISGGNPHLKPITGNNFDLDLEYYLNDSGIAEIGVFDKEFENYIFERVTMVASDPRLPNWAGPGPIHISGFGNIPSAYARGLEVAYTQKFTFLPKPFDGLGFDGNFTYVASSGAARAGDNHALPGTAPTTMNASIFYEAHGLNLRIAAQRGAHSLYQVGGDRAQDIFEDSRFTVDWTSSYEFVEGAQVYFNVKNITNAPLRLFMGAPNWVVQREFYDQTFETGVRLKL